MTLPIRKMLSTKIQEDHDLALWMKNHWNPDSQKYDKLTKREQNKLNKLK